jgi:hypothetical protein
LAIALVAERADAASCPVRGKATTFPIDHTSVSTITLPRLDTFQRYTQHKAAIMSTSPHQLFLLADHIKLSLLERQRAQSLKLPGNSTNDGPLTRSLESLRAGIDALTSNAEEQESTGEAYVLLRPTLRSTQGWQC